MSTTYDTLSGLVADLAGISGVASCRVGLERSITPADYPLIRVVPTQLLPSGAIQTARRRMEIVVYFGLTVEESSSGLPAVYAALLDLEQAIVTTLERGGAWGFGTHLETVTDEDRLDTYKIMAARFTVGG